jgi:hypothetical protein
MTGSIGPFVAIRSVTGAVAVERRVVLLSRDPGLASIAGRLLSNGDRVAHFRSAAELPNWSTPAVSAVVLDSEPQARRLGYKQVRDRYDGPLVMLLNKGERRPDLPPDGARQFLYRPFQAADLSKLLGTPGAELGPFEAAIIAAWSRHATAEQAAQARRGASYRISWHPSLRRRIRTWAATIVALIGLLLVFGLSDQGPCPGGCTSFGGAVAGATERQTPQTAADAAGSGGGGRATAPPGSAAASSQPPDPTLGGFPIVTGVGGLIQSINPISADDTLPPSGPQAVAGVPAPPGTTPPTTAPPATEPPTTAPPTTAPPTTAPPTTAPPTTEPPTTEPPTTEPPTTQPPTTEPPTTEPPTTEPPTTEPPTTEPPTTEPPTTAAPTTAAPTTAGP